MLRFIRFRLFSIILTSNVRKYLLYALGEIILITLGILIALKINDWNQDNTDRELEKIFLQRMLGDLENDIAVFSAEVEVGQKGLEAIKEAVVLMDQVDSEADVIEFNNLYDVTFMGALNPQYATYRELESTGQMNVIQNDVLRSAMLNHYAYYERMEEEFRHYSWYRKHVSRVMDAETSILKYAGGVDALFPPERRRPQDWAYFKDPDHPDFRKTEIALSAGGWCINYELWLYSLLLERIQVLQEQIESELREN